MKAYRFVFHNKKKKMQAYRINVELNESFHICCEIVSLPTLDLSGFQNCTSKKRFFLLVRIINSMYY